MLRPVAPAGWCSSSTIGPSQMDGHYHIKLRQLGWGKRSTLVPILYLKMTACDVIIRLYLRRHEQALL